MVGQGQFTITNEQNRITLRIKMDVKEIFNPDDYLYFYQSILTPERLQTEIDFLLKFARLEQPVEILDLGCGFGRHSNALAKLGHSVTGLDITQGFLDIAREESKKMGIKVDYVHDDMRNIDFENKFDRVFSMFTTLGYFNDSDNELMFQKIFRSLKPGGIFCFDSHNRDTMIAYLQAALVTEREGNMMVDQHKFDTLSGRCQTRRTIMKGDKHKTSEFSIRVYNPTEILQLFTAIGFSSCSFFGFDGVPLGATSKKMVVVAVK